MALLEEGGELRRAEMLDHLDGHDLVERLSLVDVAVIDEIDAAAVFEARRAAYVRDSAEARNLLSGPPVAWRDEAVRLLINIQGVADLSHPDAATPTASV